MPENFTTVVVMLQLLALAPLNACASESLPEGYVAVQSNPRLSAAINTNTYLKFPGFLVVNELIVQTIDQSPPAYWIHRLFVPCDGEASQIDSGDIKPSLSEAYATVGTSVPTFPLSLVVPRGVEKSDPVKRLGALACAKSKSYSSVDVMLPFGAQQDKVYVTSAKSIKLNGQRREAWIDTYLTKKEEFKDNTGQAVPDTDGKPLMLTVLAQDWPTSKWKVEVDCKASTIASRGFISYDDKGEV